MDNVFKTIKTILAWHTPTNSLHGILIDGLFQNFIVMTFFVLATILPQYQNPAQVFHILKMRFASSRECIEHVLADNRTQF